MADLFIGVAVSLSIFRDIKLLLLLFSVISISLS